MSVIGICIGDGQTERDLEKFRAGSGGYLINELELLGHQVVDYQDPRAQFFMSLDHRKNSFRIAKKHFPRDNRILFVQEPYVVIPSNYKSHIRNQYGLIISITPDKADKWFPWPQYPWGGDSSDLESVLINDRQFQAVLINSNKVSMLKGSLYGFRRSIVRYLGKKQFPLVVAGPNWDRKLFMSLIENIKAFVYSILNFRFPLVSEATAPITYPSSTKVLGIIQSKTEVMEKSVFALVIENQRNYVSEKLFDAIFAGCVPIYVGPKLSEFDIPSDVAIELGQNKKLIYETLTKISKEEIYQIRENGRRWIMAEPTKTRWSAENAYKPIAGHINNWLTRNY